MGQEWMCYVGSFKKKKDCFQTKWHKLPEDRIQNGIQTFLMHLPLSACCDLGVKVKWPFKVQLNATLKEEALCRASHRPFLAFCPYSCSNMISLLQTQIWDTDFSPSGPHPQHRNVPGLNI